jgi:hypothetical protein
MPHSRPDWHVPQLPEVVDHRVPSDGLVQRALARHQGNIRRMAAELGLSYASAWRAAKKFGDTFKLPSAPRVVAVEPSCAGAEIAFFPNLREAVRAAARHRCLDARCRSRFVIGRAVR